MTAKDQRIHLFLVDDDAVFLKSLEIEFSEAGEFIISTFATGELCIAHLDKNPDIIILDYLLNGIDRDAMHGIDTLDQIKTYDDTIPVIMLSGQDSIDVAINCMHHKAYDYVVKSETAFVRLRNNITAALHLKKTERTLKWFVDRM
ncbi:MAG: response regulator [Flavobacteriales bacterium]|nr:response regulator [Flavobacteriales bacterium]